LPVVILGLGLLLAGCAKKAPDVNPAPAPHEAPTPPPTTTVAPPTPAPSKPAIDPFAGDIEAVNRYVREQGLLSDVMFDYDRDQLRPDARQQLEANARFLKEYPQFRVALEGHADERGTVEYNLALGQKRASTARTFLDTMGVEHDRLAAATYGEERPVCTERLESCWQRNRRVHFEIVGRVE
jgi:peptidoglycan-associated lipoprotein